CGSHVTAIRNCVTALDCFPGRMLCRAEFFLLRRMPTNCRWVKNDFSATKGRQPRSLGVPLVPADAHADFPPGGFPCPESEVARRKIKFFVIQRIVRNMHFSIFPEQFSIRINHHRSVVIKPGATLLEK